MVGGAHGQAGCHVLQHVGMVTEPGNVFVTTLSPQEVEITVQVATLREKLVTLQSVQV